MMQQQANRERVIIRTSLPANLPPIVADARSVRQIALNLLSNSIKFTGAGGQVIVSTALNDDNEVVLRVRDTGVGMSEKESADRARAVPPARDRRRAGAQAAPASACRSPRLWPRPTTPASASPAQLDDGTLVEVAFPATRVLAE